MTCTRRSTAHSRPARNATPLPRRSAPRTRTEMMSTSGARPTMMPAHAVPWPNRSTASSGTTCASSLMISTATLSTNRPATLGWLPSTPLSRMATVTPAPVEPPHAHSRSMRGTPANLASLGRASSMKGSDHAGSSWSVIYRCRSDAAAAARGVRGDHLENVGHEAQLTIRKSTQLSDPIDNRPERHIVAAVEAGGGARDESIELLIGDLVVEL